MRKKKVWEHRKSIMHHFEILEFLTPPSNVAMQVSLESNNEDKDLEVLDDLEYEEQDV